MKKVFKCFYKKKVVITGHTGFKGSWLSLWLYKYGAKILGISNEIPTEPSHYKLIDLNKKIQSAFIDIRNYEKIKKKIMKFQPDFIFHLAAQALVKKSYDDPYLTFTTNSIGTLNILEVCKNLKNKCKLIIITSDKSYKNLEIKRGYNENDILGGGDPYSGSKASAEMIINSYSKSFFLQKNSKIIVGVARAGNVIGGGDWSKDRLIPDCMRSWCNNKVAYLRNPNSTRPWQHVLEVIYGYIKFASIIDKNRLNGEILNFGPKEKNNFKVIDVVNKMASYWDKVKWRSKKNTKFHESNLLKLNSRKVKKLINWQSILDFNTTIVMVISWYKFFLSEKKNKKKIYNFSLSQIKFYENILENKK